MTHSAQPDLLPGAYVHAGGGRRLRVMQVILSRGFAGSERAAVEALRGARTAARRRAGRVQRPPLAEAVKKLANRAKTQIALPANQRFAKTNFLSFRFFHSFAEAAGAKGMIPDPGTISVSRYKLRVYEYRI